MYSTHETITGLIEFDPGVARQTLLVRCASDDTLQSTLASLALDLLADVDPEGDDWNELQIVADVEALERDLLVVYRRVQRRVAG
jgi:hypothetical protein